MSDLTFADDMGYLQILAVGTGESPDVEEHGIDSTLHGKIPMKDNDKSNHNQENRNNLEFISDQNSEHQSG
ncbi:hypothetical protein L2E82_14058 [Cichorium intybus]|uniref:Uncharacterized protein n=1 Tax=Cichorium intybus TaxID=13427 RepID=A0ACB9EZR0_CICIN|nr:hypothetical protein L2E82_14058 [Cichorium intybus]